MPAWNWGVPDWRNAAAYEAQRSPRQWRWEFLRRRQDYREDWLMHYEPSRREALAIFGNMPLPEGVTSWEDHYSGIASFPDSAWKYGIAPLVDPSRTCSEFELWQYFQHEHPYLLRFASRERFGEIEDTGRAVVVFDLNKPLSEQLRKAERKLRISQVNKFGSVSVRRPHEQRWPVYLRAIDARDAGERLETIGRDVLGRIDDAAQHARNTLRQADRVKLLAGV
jgi:hypothetical protein